MSDLIEKSLFFLIDLSKGLKTQKYYDLYNQSKTWRLDQLRQYQNNKLQELVNHAYKNTQFYKDVFEKIGIQPKDIRNKNDLKNLPCLEREDILNNREKIIDHNNKYYKIFASSSSGTTGTPLKYYHDINGESAGIAAGYYFFSLSGWKLGEKTIHIWGNQQSVKNWRSLNSKLKRKIIRQKNYPAFFLNDPKNYPNFLNLIKYFNPLFIDGYASSIGSFASWLCENNIHLNGVKVVFTTAENLTPLAKANIESCIGPVSDLYGCGEINGIAIQPVGINKYYTLDPHVIVETVMKDGINELIVTDLDNRIMPFIRYKTGDVIDKLDEPSNKNHLPFSSFFKLEGRISDFIKLPSGKIIHPVNTLGGTFLRKFPQIKRHRVIWDGYLLKFEIECDDNIQITDLEKEIKKNLLAYDVKFIVEIKEKILPGKSGKFRYVEIEQKN